MTTITTTGRVADDLMQVTLAAPLPVKPRGEVRIKVEIDEAEPVPTPPFKSFHDAIGSYYRDFPDEPRRTTAEWMAELREGEYEEEQ